jgi:hypothetical protein
MPDSRASLDFRIKGMLTLKMTGKQIAQRLHDENYSIDEVHSALYQAGFVVVIRPTADRQISQLRVSNTPLSAGAEAIEATEKQDSLPAVIWD